MRTGMAALGRKMRKRWQLYAFIAFPVIHLLVFSYYPMFGVQIAFKQYNPALGIWGSPWVGLSNFTRFFQSFQFGRVMRNTLTISLYSLAASFPLAFVFALMINLVRSNRFKKAVQTITYMPNFISTVVIVGLLFQLLDNTNGLYAGAYKLFGGEGYPRNLFADPGLFIHMYVWSGIWQGLGWSTIIYLAALSGVDPEQHEAAMIDGATRLRRVVHIDFPTIVPTATIMLIMSVGGVLNVGFEKVFLMQNDMNLRASEVISTYVYKVGMQSGGTNFSYASAIGLFNSVVGLILLVLVNFVTRRVGDGVSLW